MFRGPAEEKPPVLEDALDLSEDLSDSSAIASGELLPEGFVDLLPPHAGLNRALAGAVLSIFESFGYREVKPAMLVYESSFFARGAQNEAFFLQDPLSHRPMVLRSDMTPHMARLAQTRLSEAPRPLRLAYAGTVLRTRKARLGTLRAWNQAGVELFGPEEPAAEQEILTLALEALAHVGVRQLVVDLTLPDLARHVLEQARLRGPEKNLFAQALRNRDQSYFEAKNHQTVLAILRASRNKSEQPPESLNVYFKQKWREAFALMAFFESRPRPPASGSHAGNHTGNHGRAPEDSRVTFSFDPLESTGFPYHGGVGFSFFDAHTRREIGRGGRYLATRPGNGARDGTRRETREPAIGLSFHLDALEVGRYTEAFLRPMVYVPAQLKEVAAALRAAGHHVWVDFADVPDPVVAARQHGCTHLWSPGSPGRPAGTIVPL